MPVAVAAIALVGQLVPFAGSLPRAVAATSTVTTSYLKYTLDLSASVSTVPASGATVVWTIKLTNETYQGYSIELTPANDLALTVCDPGTLQWRSGGSAYASATVPPTGTASMTCTQTVGASSRSSSSTITNKLSVRHELTMSYGGTRYTDVVGSSGLGAVSSSITQEGVSAPAPDPTTPGGSGGAVVSSDGSLKLVKTADNYSLPVGGGKVTYTYALTNLKRDTTGWGANPAYDNYVYYGEYPSHRDWIFYQSLVDDKCPGVRTASGLEYYSPTSEWFIRPGRSATFSCTMSVTSTTTNTAKADFYSYTRAPISVSASATVTVATPGGGTGTINGCDAPVLASDAIVGSTGSSGHLFQLGSDGSLRDIADLSQLASARGNATIYRVWDSTRNGYIWVSDYRPYGTYDTYETIQDPYRSSAAVAMNLQQTRLVYYVPRLWNGKMETPPTNGLWVYDTVAKTATRVTADGPATNTVRLTAAPDGSLWSLAQNSHLYRLAPGATTWQDKGAVLSSVNGASVNFSTYDSGDIVFDGAGTMWFIGSNENDRLNYLFTISASELNSAGTIDAQFVGNMGSGWFYGLSFNTKGELLATGYTGSNVAYNSLYRVDMKSGATALLLSSGADESRYGQTGDSTSCALPKPELRVSKSAPRLTNPDGTVDFTVTIENIGSLSATGVTFVDSSFTNGTYISSTLNGRTVGSSGVNHWSTPKYVNGATTPPSSTIAPGQIAPGDKATIVIRLKQRDVATLKVCNQATATYVGDPTPGGTLSDDPSQAGADDPTCSLAPKPAIALDKVGTGDTVDEARNASRINQPKPVTYTYYVSNTGNEPLKDVTLTDDRCSGTCTVRPKLAAGATTNVGDSNLDGLLDLTEVWQYTLTQDIAVETKNIAVVTAIGKFSGKGVDATDNWTVTLPPADLAVTKTVSSPIAQVVAGQQVTWKIVVSNKGPVSSSGVTITDTVPPNFTGVSAQIDQGSCQISLRTVTCVSSGVIAAGQSRTVTLTATAPPESMLLDDDPSNDCFTNTATIVANEADPVTSNNSATTDKVCMVPAPKGAFRVTKLDARTRDVLPGAEFSLYRTTSDVWQNGLMKPPSDACSAALRGGQAPLKQRITAGVDITGMELSNYDYLAQTSTTTGSYVVYCLVETKAPRGYNLLAEPITFILDNSNAVLNVDVDDAATNLATPLPTVGGPGVDGLELVGALSLMALGMGVHRRRCRP